MFQESVGQGVIDEEEVSPALVEGSQGEETREFDDDDDDDDDDEDRAAVVGEDLADEHVHHSELGAADLDETVLSMLTACIEDQDKHIHAEEEQASGLVLEEMAGWNENGS